MAQIVEIKLVVDNAKSNIALSPFKTPSITTSNGSFVIQPSPFAGNLTRRDAGLIQGTVVASGGIAIYATTDPETLLVLGAFRSADYEPPVSAKALFVAASTAITADFAREVERRSRGNPETAEHEFKREFNPYDTGSFKLSVSAEISNTDKPRAEVVYKIVKFVWQESN